MFYWEQLRVSGLKLFYLSVKKAGAPACRQAGFAKTVTNLLILLSVLAGVLFC